MGMLKVDGMMMDGEGVEGKCLKWKLLSSLTCRAELPEQNAIGKKTDRIGKSL